MSLLKKNSGVGLVEVMIATGITGIIAYVIMNLFVNANKTISTTRTSSEAQDIIGEIKSLLANTENCTSTFGNQGINPQSPWSVTSSTFSLKKHGARPPSPATQAQIDAWLATTTDVYKVGDFFGVGKAIYIKAYKIDEQTEVGKVPYQISDNTALLHVLFSRNEGSYVREFERVAPLYVEMQGGGIKSCRALMLDDQIWQRTTNDATNIFFDGIGSSASGSDTHGLIGMGIDQPMVPSTVQMHRRGGDSVLGITSTGNHDANILFCSDVAVSSSNINSCQTNIWKINSTGGSFNLVSIASGASGGTLAMFKFSDVGSTVGGGTGRLITIPAFDSSTHAEIPDKGLAFSANGLIIANRPTQGNLSSNISCSAAFGGDTSGSCAGAAGAFYTGEGFALGTAFGYRQGVPNGWVGGAPGILAGESVTAGSVGAFQISGKGMFIAENSTLADVIACYNNFDTTLIGGANTTACSNATGGFFGRAGFAVGTGVSGGSGYIIGLPGVIGGETVTGGTSGAFKVSGKGLMIADESSITSVEACYNATIPGSVDTGNPCGTATGGFFGKWGFAIGTGASTTTSGLKGYVWGRPGIISGETETGGTSGAFSLSGGGLFVAADGSNITNLISCYAALSGDPGSCTGAAGAFIGQNGLALGAAGGPYVVLNPNLLEISNSTEWVRIRSNGNIDVSATVTAASDSRLKKNIESLDIQEQLKNITDLNPVSYVLKSDSKEHKHLGFIAQEVQKLFPELVYENEKTGTLSLNYLGLIAPLTRAVQALIDLFNEFGKKQEAMQAEIQNQKTLLDAQSAVIAEQNAKINKLQSDLELLMRDKNINRQPAGQ